MDPQVECELRRIIRSELNGFALGVAFWGCATYAAVHYVPMAWRFLHSEQFTSSAEYRALASWYVFVENWPTVLLYLSIIAGTFYGVGWLAVKTQQLVKGRH